MDMTLAQNSKEIIDKLAQKYSLELILLFGSQVTGKTHKESDFDIAYSSKRRLSIKEESELIIGLMSVVNITDERLINLVNIKTTSPLLFYAITSNCQILFSKDDLIFPTMRAYAFKKFVETKPLYDLKRDRLKNSLFAIK